MPVVPRCSKAAVILQIDFGEIRRRSGGQTLGDFRERRHVGRLTIDLIELTQRLRDAVLLQSLEEDDGVQIIPRGVTRREQPRLDARHLGERRNPQSRDFLRFQRSRAPQLTNPGQNAVEGSENEHRYAFGLPARGRFQGREHLVEPLAQIFDDVIAVHADTVAGMHGRCGPPDEHGARHEMLQVAFSREQSFPIWNPVLR